MADMDLIVVDLETTGLDSVIHRPLEVAAINVTTGEELYFVPFIDSRDMVNADPESLRINRYYERGVFRNMLKSTADNMLHYNHLFTMLRGKRFGGANPRFDAQMLTTAANMPESWHYRLADVCSYTSGALGLDGSDIRGLHDICASLSVEQSEAHSALDDARVTAECFRRAMERRR
ncbi:3'-5' exonuclease [Mycobacteroides abscessus]|uniref:3'-5' exonuclease n=1 Tax=Mycobacteroides abscessus TaxID=36809 RepID=UPI0009290E32|nr:exonuclease domain-containing protein [Mycobacteroides abscessus]DAZ90296.1 TPA_asm: DnaQ-like (DNA polymerase III subunit) [Mycobacterium phage prophiFSQJ01-1]SII40192.1 DNA polymerase III, epsilon subunit (DnaQ) [Mycobacteroides abscessus subsp. abscessus]SIK15089.1 DNA polymerase III, epsilon subunit (DnaQ) [Mycobacteroides abscessus subsp. abscessus]SIN24816.1 DNA polymerase III, epsilon subunit (DnaQ) [Mycobacteroides abscessus subsp. abscessus]SLI52125.1 DNA polymerase III, epsilon su